MGASGGDYILTFEMRPIAPADLTMAWPEIRFEISSIEAPDHFIPEDVYAACKSAEATLFFLFADERRIGWIVLKRLGSDLHIWLLYAKSGYDVMTLFKDDLVKIGHAANCKMVTFGTKRKGWERVAPKHDFVIRQTVYELAI